MIFETTINIFDLKHEEILGVEKMTTVAMFFRIEDITAVRESIEDGDEEINPDKCNIYMRSGEYFIISTPYKEILRIFNRSKY